MVVEDEALHSNAIRASDGLRSYDQFVCSNGSLVNLAAMPINPTGVIKLSSIAVEGQCLPPDRQVVPLIKGSWL